MKTNNSGNCIETDAWSDLASVEKEIRKEIGAFALNRLSQAARWLERTDALQKRQDSLAKEALERLREGKALLNPTELVENQQPEAGASAGHDNVLLGNSLTRGGKARGRECRAAFVAEQAKQGEHLARIRGALYRNSGGLAVGIAYAKGRKNEWFLGLPAGEFNEAVLLCEGSDCEVQPIHLTESFLEKYGKRISISSQYNQAKFNVQFRAGRYILVVNGIGDVDLTEYVADQRLVCQHHRYA